MPILDWSHKSYKSCDIEDEHSCHSNLQLSNINSSHGSCRLYLKFTIQPIYGSPNSIDSYRIVVYSLESGCEFPIDFFDDLKTMNDAKTRAELVAVNYVKNAIEDLTKILSQSGDGNVDSKMVS